MSDFFPVQLDTQKEEGRGVQKEETARGRGKGVVLGKDGKPCRSCTSFRNWARSSAVTATEECPPDVEELGRATWTFLHSMAAQYPDQPSLLEQTEMRTFLRIFSRVYPCWHCADEFQQWIARPGNEPRVRSSEQLGRWLCECHNDVSKRLGKPAFDCNQWRKRWRDGCQ